MVIYVISIKEKIHGERVMMVVLLVGAGLYQGLLMQCRIV